MSFSVEAIGRPAAVKAEIRRQFVPVKANLKESYPHEHATACLSEEIFENQLNFLSEHTGDKAVRVRVSGHAWRSDGTINSDADTSVPLTIETLPNFVDAIPEPEAEAPATTA